MSQDRNENRRRQQLLKNAGYSVNIDGSWGPYQNKLWMHYLGNQVQQKKPSYSVAPVIAIPGGAGVAAAARYAPQVVRYLQGLAAAGAIAENFTDGSELGTASQLAPSVIWNGIKSLFSKGKVNNTQPRNPKGKRRQIKEQSNKNPEPPKDAKESWKTKIGKGILGWQGVAAGGDLLNNVINHTNEDYQWGLTKNATPVGWLIKGSEAFREPTKTPTAPKATTPQEIQDQFWKEYENY